MLAAAPHPNLWSNDLGTPFLREQPVDQARALFDYLFVPAEGPAIGTDNRGVGFRLRDIENRQGTADDAADR
jgi:hypothetical protein